MPEEWFEIAYINFDEAILHGRMTDGFDEFRVRKEREVRKVLSADEKRRVEDLQIHHRMEMDKLLGEIARAESPLP